MVLMVLNVLQQGNRGSLQTFNIIYMKVTLDLENGTPCARIKFYLKEIPISKFHTPQVSILLPLHSTSFGISSSKQLRPHKQSSGNANKQHIGSANKGNAQQMTNNMKSEGCRLK